MNNTFKEQFNSAKNDSDSYTVPNVRNMNMIELVRTYINNFSGKSVFSSGRNLINHLSSIEKHFNVTILPQQINNQFMSMYVKFFLSMKPQTLSLASLRVDTAYMKKVLIYAINCGLDLQKDDFISFIVPQEDIDYIALREDEISYIYHYPIELVCDERPQALRNLIRTKDAFCLMCNLGLTFQNLLDLSPKNFANDSEFYQTFMYKSKQKKSVFIDIDDMSVHPEMTKNIMRRYKYSSPVNCSASNFNRYLKKYLKMIGFNATVAQLHKIDGFSYYTEIPETDMINAYTARRSFVKINKERNKSSFKIMEATGYTTEHQLMNVVDSANVKVVKQRMHDSQYMHMKTPLLSF